MEIAEMSDGTTEGSQSQSSRYAEHLEKSTLLLTRRDFGECSFGSFIHNPQPPCSKEKQRLALRV
jgi:hypothetical protein